MKSCIKWQHLTFGHAGVCFNDNKNHERKNRCSIVHFRCRGSSPFFSHLRGGQFEAMSLYSTPFLVLNLGSEMIFVIAQRLQAQNISEERSTLGDIFISSARFEWGIFQGALRFFSIASLLSLASLSHSHE